MKKGKQLLHRDGIKQDQTAADLTNSAPSSIVKKQSTTVMKPDIGILSKDFLKNKGREQPTDKQFAIHRKKRAAAVDVDVGILDKRRRRQQTSDLNLKNLMCPGENGRGGYYYFNRLIDETYGNFPKCSCPSPTTCGPNLCECLELDANGDILQCMDPFKQLCGGAMYIDGIPGPWSMEECLGSKLLAISYCSFLPCFVDGSSYWQCVCNFYVSYCTESRDPRICAISACCQAQSDDEGREACILGDLSQNYGEEETSFSISDEEMISRFNECSFNSDGDKSIVQCYCESFSYGQCVNRGVAFPVLCEAMNCCFEQTEDDARLDCFTTRFKSTAFYNHYRDTIQESCVASGRSSDQCKCDIHGLSNCVYGIDSYNREPHCDLFQCCQSQTVDDGRKDCLVQNEAQFVYERCANDGNTTEACVCDKSSNLCSSGHSNDQHCVLSSCCEEQADDTGRKECIGNFTTSQPSSAPSEILADNSIHEDEAEASPTDGDNVSTSSASIISCWIDATMRLVLAAVVGIIWLSQ